MRPLKGMKKWPAILLAMVLCLSFVACTAGVTPLLEFDTLFGSYFDRSNNKRSVDHLVHFYEDEKKKALEENNSAMVKELAPVTLDNSLI